jgi:hypothetical protein
MKCELIRDDLECTAKEPDESQTVIKEILRSGKIVKRRFWNSGAMIDDSRCFRLVQMGVAIPADDECREAAGMTPEQIRAAKHAYGRLLAGIRPEDYGLYDRGVITGYNPDGSYKLGPNGHELEVIEEEEDDVFDEE